MTTETIRAGKDGETKITGVLPLIIAASGCDPQTVDKGASATKSEFDENFTSFTVKGVPGVRAAKFRNNDGTLELWELS